MKKECEVLSEYKEVAKQIKGLPENWRALIIKNEKKILGDYPTNRDYSSAVTFLVFGYGAYAAGFETTSKLTLPLIRAAIAEPKKPEGYFKKNFSEVPYFF